MIVPFRSQWLSAFVATDTHIIVSYHILYLVQLCLLPNEEETRPHFQQLLCRHLDYFKTIPVTILFSRSMLSNLVTYYSQNYAGIMRCGHVTLYKVQAYHMSL